MMRKGRIFVGILDFSATDVPSGVSFHLEDGTGPLEITARWRGAPDANRRFTVEIQEVAINESMDSSIRDR
jgi:hypothetical protein